MGIFKIEGGVALKGEITPQGAKNEALQILCAILLTPEKVTINNIPDIIDINKLITLLGNLGVKIQKNAPGSYTFQADEVNVNYLETEAFKKEGGRKSRPGSRTWGCCSSTRRHTGSSLARRLTWCGSLKARAATVLTKRRSRARWRA